MKISMSPTVIIPQEISLPFPILLLLFLPLIFLLSKRLKTSFSKTPPLPPGPLPWPILGNIPHLGSDPLYVTLSRLAKTYGSDIISLKLGAQTLVVGSTRAAAKEILKTNDWILSARHVPHVFPVKSPELNNFSVGWIFECSDRWKYLRSICRTKLFSIKAMQSQACIREKKVMEMLGVISKMQGKEVKIKDIVFATLLNMISNALVSRDVTNFEQEAFSGEISRTILSNMELACVPNISDLYPILGKFDLQNLRKRFLEMDKRLSKLLDLEAVVKERKERIRSNASSHEEDLLDVMVKDGFSQDQINVLLVELLSAGTDTSALTIEWTLTELLKNPKCMKIVEEELAREIGCSQELRVAESDLPKLKYLEACVKESLRLHPPGPLPIPRRASETCQVMNYTIPKDSQVLINVWAIGRDPSYWEDPLVFKPERFLNSSLDFRGNSFEFLPFGGGRRICPGLPMAAKLVPLVTASLIHSFDWSLPHGKGLNQLDMAEKYDVNLRKKEPLVLVPKAKLSC